MKQSFKGYMEDKYPKSNADISKFAEYMCAQIDKLNSINTNVDFTPDYEQGYEDACTAIKNTLISGAEMTREELINEDWGKEYSKLADLYAKKCKEVRELKDKNKQIRAKVIKEVANEILNLPTKYIDNFDYVSVALILNKLEQLKENK